MTEDQTRILNKNMSESEAVLYLESRGVKFENDTDAFNRKMEAKARKVLYSQVPQKWYVNYNGDSYQQA